MVVPQPGPSGEPSDDATQPVEGGPMERWACAWIGVALAVCVVLFVVWALIDS